MPFDFHCDIHYGGFFGGYDTLKGDSQCLELIIDDSTLPPKKPVLLHPSEEELLIFVDSIKKYKWKSEYFSDVCDGTQWKVVVKTNDFKINSWGSNSFPADFADFIKSLRELIKCPEFASGCEDDMETFGTE